MVEIEEADYALVLQQIGALDALQTSLGVLPEAIAADVSGRMAARVLLGAFYQFLISAHFSSTTLGPIVDLLGALEALDAGKTLPLVKAKRVGRGSKVVADVEWIPRIIAAAALELKYREFRRLGTTKSLDAAASWVVGKIQEWPALRYSISVENHMQIDKGRIKKWRTYLDASFGTQAGSLFKLLISKDNKYTAEQVLTSEPIQWGFATKKFQ